jgi:hypothetical protein
MEVTSVVSLRAVFISADVEDLIELEIVSNRVGEIVDSSDCAIELIMNVDTLGSAVDISGEVDLVISFSSVDDNMSVNTSEVVVMTFIELVDVDVIVWVFDISFDDIRNEDFVEVIPEVVNNVVLNLLFSLVLDESPVVSVVIELVLASEFLLLIVVGV